MKYGVIYYKDTDNIGDDIQNYAAMQFLPHIDYLINREELNLFLSENDEQVAVIMNGWFLHNKFNWPPAKSIYPLCISMHFTPNDYIGIGYKFLDEAGGEYLKCYEPIGCRDSNTQAILEARGIQCYLSGCVTLTLRNRKKLENCGKYICLVDVPEEIERVVKEKINGTEIQLKKITHWVQNPAGSWEERIQKVEELLDVYQNAFCVITKRLHCALPCLALHTPVLLVLDDEKDDITRYSHFTELLHSTSTENFINGKTGYDICNPVANKEDYLIERQKLTDSITKFVNDAENNRINENFFKWKLKDDKEISEWRQNLLSCSAEYASHKVDALLRELNEIKAKKFRDTENFAKQYECDTNTLKKEIERLNDIIIRYQQAAGTVLRYRDELEFSSVIWVIFFSKEFKCGSIKQKAGMLWSALRGGEKKTGFTNAIDGLKNIYS